MSDQIQPAKHRVTLTPELRAKALERLKTLMPAKVSTEPTQYAIICKRDEQKPDLYPGCGQIFLTTQEYLRQLERPHDFWICPICGNVAFFDDENFERYLDE